MKRYKARVKTERGYARSWDGERQFIEASSLRVAINKAMRYVEKHDKKNPEWVKIEASLVETGN